MNLKVELDIAVAAGSEWIGVVLLDGKPTGIQVDGNSTRTLFHYIRPGTRSRTAVKYQGGLIDCLKRRQLDLERDAA